MKPEIYNASLDSFTKTMTWFIIILLASTGFRSIIGFTKAAGNLTVLFVQGGTLFLLVVILLGAYLFSP